MNAEEAIQQVVVKAKKKKGAKFPSVSSSAPEPRKAPESRRTSGPARILGAIASEGLA